MQIIVADSAWQDLAQTADCIGKNSLQYAEEFSLRVFLKIEHLQDYPRSGRVVPECNNDDIREVFLGNIELFIESFPQKLQ